MKKILILLAAILFGVSASFAQVYKVKVSWNDDNCGCTGTVSGSYFKVQLSVYDDANSTWVIQNKQVNTSDAAADHIVIDVPEVSDYCDHSHSNTPSFTTSAAVWLMCDTTNPPSAVCSGSGNIGPKNCHDFYSSVITVPPITLN